MKLFLLILIYLFLFNPISQKSYEIELPEVVIKSKYTTQGKWLLFRQLGRELPLTITPEVFANCCMVVYWCESNLETTSVNKENFDSQGFFQCTNATRKLLGFPSLRELSFDQQLVYFKKYLLATEKVSLIKDSRDLHELNYAPSRFGQKILSSVGMKDRKDLQRFQERRVVQSSFVKNCYSQLYP